MDTDNPFIRLKGIEYSYSDRPPVLKGVDFTFYKGDRIGLVGSNGSGKTTLFHLIMGLLKPKTGSIEILGRQRMVERRDSG